MTTLGLGSGIGEGGGRYTESTEYGALRNRICSRPEKEWGVHFYFCYYNTQVARGSERDKGEGNTARYQETPQVRLAV